MTLEEFKETLNENTPPPDIDILLKALWMDAKGDWEQAHKLAQSVNNADGAWVHAYLHRKEGDTSNANYWYTRADRQMPDISLQEEWEEITDTLLT